jgi:hypothetical protein
MLSLEVTSLASQFEPRRDSSRMVGNSEVMAEVVLGPVYNVGGVVNIFFPVARGIFMRLQANL